MPKTLTFLHTAPVHITTFERLLAETAPRIPDGANTYLTATHNPRSTPGITNLAATQQSPAATINRWLFSR